MSVERSLDTWREFGAAVAYVADVELPGLTVWDALAAAVSVWLDDRSAGTGTGDKLRSAVADLMERSPEAGAPGGVPLGEILEAAMCDWTSATAVRLNDGKPFNC